MPPAFSDLSLSFDILTSANLDILSNYTTERKFGFNPSVGTTQEVLWDAGGGYTFLTTAAALRVAAGGNAADTAAGNGARSVTIQGLDENFLEAEETIATAGASASSFTTTTFIRVFRVWVEDAGVYNTTGIPSTGNNTGAIAIENAGGDVVAQINATRGQTQMAIYTVPAGKTGYITEFNGSAETGKPVTFRCYRRNNADVTTAPVCAVRLLFQTINDTLFEVPPQAFIMLEEKTDVWWTGQRETGSSAADVNFDILLVDNET